VPQCSTPCNHLAGYVHSPSLTFARGLTKACFRLGSNGCRASQEAYSAYVRARCGLNQSTTVVLIGRGRHFSGIHTKYQIAGFTPHSNLKSWSRRHSSIFTRHSDFSLTRGTNSDSHSVTDNSTLLQTTRQKVRTPTDELLNVFPLCKCNFQTLRVNAVKILAF
jgi:hypothetical protein